MPIVLTDEDEKFFTENPNALLDFSAKWCGPCKLMKPNFAAAEKFMAQTDTKITFAVVDVDESRKLAEDYEISAMPTLILIKAGQVVETHQGALNDKAILMMIARHFDVNEKVSVPVTAPGPAPGPEPGPAPGPEPGPEPGPAPVPESTLEPAHDG
jgi:thioredoxin 1